jgi:hypothetical protein
MYNNNGIPKLQSPLVDDLWSVTLVTEVARISIFGVFQR